MIHKSIKYISLFFFTSAFAVAQTDTLTNRVVPSNADSYFRFNYDNDFFSATDIYYTQGIYLELIMPFFKKSPFSKVLMPLKKSATNYYGINVEQDVFTPKSIRHDSIFYGERPYAAVFFASQFLVSTNIEKQQRLTTQLDLGIIGPNAKGEQEQKAIHKALVNLQPLGWQYQITNDVIINYDLQFEKGLFIKKAIELIGFADARIGTLYDDAGVGAQLRAGWMQPYFNNLGLTKNKENKGYRKFQGYIFTKGEMKGVAYNATMQGGVFNTKSIYTLPSESIERVIGIAYVGIVLAYKRFSVEYTKAYLTPEFKNGLNHGWGHCVITVCF
jgi:lipid A 3-O-deacylase